MKVLRYYAPELALLAAISLVVAIIVVATVAIVRYNTEATVCRLLS